MSNKLETAERQSLLAYFRKDSCSWDSKPCKDVEVPNEAFMDA